MAGDVTRNYKIRYSVEDRAAAPIAKVGTTATATAGQVDGLTARLKPLNDALAWLGQGASVSADFVKELGLALNGIPKDTKARLDGISSGLGRVDFNAGTATRSVEGLNGAFGAVAGRTAEVNQLQAAVQKTQRSTYGLFKNAELATGALGAMGQQASGVQALGTATADLSGNLKVTHESAKGATSGMGGLTVALLALGAASTVVDSIGESIRKAREDTEGWAEDTLKLRDELRELANLQGQPGADDEVVRKHLAMRIETGMTDPEARKFDEQFRGSLPLAKDAGGITDDVADPLAKGVGRLAVRTGLEGGTAGDLAGVMGQFESVPNAQVGLGRAQQVVDLLNDGRGNLTPLTKELMKDAAATVGDNKMFRSLTERAAAISVSTGMGAIGRSSTRINQAIAGLSGFAKNQGDALRLHGIKDTDDFETRVRKIAPLVRFANREGKDPLAYLGENGFDNQVEQKAIVGFVDNLDALRRRAASVKEDPAAPNAKALAAGDRSAKLNQQFLENDKAARNRVAEAKLQSSKISRGKEFENLEIERKEAEQRLQQGRQIDTPETNFQDQLRGGFGLSEKLGAPSGRQIRIDTEIKRQALEALEMDRGKGKLAANDPEVQALSENGPAYAANYLASRRKRGPLAPPKVNPGRANIPGQRAVARPDQPIGATGQFGAIGASGGVGGAIGGAPGGAETGAGAGEVVSVLGRIEALLQKANPPRVPPPLPGAPQARPLRP